MSSAPSSDPLESLRSQLAPVVSRFEEVDPALGLLAMVPVEGGVFLHPKTRERITHLWIYGAGDDRVKIVEPRFLRSLPRIPVAGLTGATQLCALVAKTLSTTLVDLGRFRDQLSAMGLSLDLEDDMLRLRGETYLGGVLVEMVTSAPRTLLVSALNGRALAGLVPPERRLLALTGHATADLDQLAMLARWIHTTLVQPPSQPPEILELTETVEQADAGPAEVVVLDRPKETGQPPPGESTVAERLGPLRLRDLVRKLGSDVEVSAYGGRLRLVIPMRVVQGCYTFYLEQRGPTFFMGILITPKGNKHRIQFDLAEVSDIKDVFDKVMLSPGAG